MVDLTKILFIKSRKALADYEGSLSGPVIEEQRCGDEDWQNAAFLDMFLGQFQQELAGI